mmetsp:Transcript_23062/g.32008  ORF Transcript_23062/g.32008 Transcript_23062/m.32008 type:complete len:360 (+) Transcript_23062:420-1499(+)
MMHTSLSAATSAFFLHISTGSDPDPAREDQEEEEIDKDTLEGLSQKGFRKDLSGTKKMSILTHAAADSEEFQVHLEKWNTYMQEECDRIRGAVEEWRIKKGVKAPLSTGFLTPKPRPRGACCLALVDAYELEVRLKHLLKRIDVLLRAAQCKMPSIILPHLFLGNALCAQSYHTLEKLGITHIITMAPELELKVPSRFVHVEFDVEDREAAVEEVTKVMRAVSDAVTGAVAAGGRALLHCFEGRSRSATAALAYLMLEGDGSQSENGRTGGWDLKRAYNHMHQQHPDTKPNPYFCAALNTLNKELWGMGVAEVALLRDRQACKRPEPKFCPICGVIVGLSMQSVKSHVRSYHKEILNID